MEDEDIQEEQWVREARAGSQAAFEELFKLRYSMIFQLAYRICGNRGDAEDVAQDVFIKVAANIRQFEGKGSWRGWLYRMTVNRTRDYQRKTGRLTEVQAAFAVENPAGFAAEGDGNPERVAELVGALPQAEKEAIVLTYYEGLNHAEAAKICGCAETTISWRVYQAKRRLKKKWKELSYER